MGFAHMGPEVKTPQTCWVSDMCVSEKSREVG